MRVAAVDLGTNSMRLLVVDTERNELERTARVTSLGKGVDRARRFDAERLAATLDVVAEYGAVVRSLGVDRIGAVATSAARDADNAPELLDGVEERLGVRPRIIDGEEEASLSFAGATAGDSGDPPYLVIDVGGGSTEFVYGEVEPEYAVSIDIGSVRLTERALPMRPASPVELADATGAVDALFAGVVLPGDPATVIGVAGTFTSLAGIHADLPAHDRGVVHGRRMDLADFAALVERLALLTIEETEAIPSLDPKRAPVILAGAVVAGAALRRSGAASLVVSEHDLLDGLAMSLVS